MGLLEPDAGTVIVDGLDVPTLPRRELYGLGNLDPVTYLTTIGIFIAAVASAALWPARRALRVDPLRALRTE